MRLLCRVFWSPMVVFRSRVPVRWELKIAALWISSITVVTSFAFLRFESRYTAAIATYLAASSVFVGRLLFLPKGMTTWLALASGLQFPFVWLAGGAYLVCGAVVLGDPGDCLGGLFSALGLALAPMSVFAIYVLAASSIHPPLGNAAYLTQSSSVAQVSAALARYSQSLRWSAPIILERDVSVFCWLWVFVLWGMALHARTRIGRWRAGSLVASWIAILWFSGIFFKA